MSKSRSEQIAENRTYWEELFETRNEPQAYYDTKFYYGSEGNEVVRFLEKELKFKEGIYVEYSPDRTLVPFLPDRKLYYYKYLENWEEAYPIKNAVRGDGKSFPMYEVPLSYLEEVASDRSVSSIRSKIRTNISEEPLENTDKILNLTSSEDIALSDATLKDFAAIMLRAPVSNKNWLNEIIMRYNTINNTK